MDKFTNSEEAVQASKEHLRGKITEAGIKAGHSGTVRKSYQTEVEFASWSEKILGHLGDSVG